jgi:hypothetical protein
MGRLRLLLAAAALLFACVIWFLTAPGTEVQERKRAKADSAEQPPSGANEAKPQDAIKQRDLFSRSSSTPLPPRGLDTTVAQRHPLPSPPTLPPELAAKARQNFVRMVKTRTREDLEAADFFQSLPQEKKTALVDLLADNEASFAESVSRLARQGKIVSEDEFKVLREKQEDSIKSLLGETEYQSYRQHASTRSDRIVVQETTEQLGRPLSEDNAHELLAVLAEERQRLLQSAAPSKEVQLQAMAQMADRIKTRAAEFLQSDEEQLALQEVLDRISQVPRNGATPNFQAR